MKFRPGLFLLCQFLFVGVLTFFGGLVYGAISISEGTAWVFPVNFLSLGRYWEPLGWWDSVLGEALLFFQMVAAPLLAGLFARMFGVRGYLGRSYFGSVMGGLVASLFFVAGLASSHASTTILFSYLALPCAPLGSLLGYVPVRKSSLK